MGKLFAETIFGIPWLALAVIALVVAIVYVVIDTGAGSGGWRWIVLRWCHPLCWLFLATAALARARVTPVPVDWAGTLGAAGGLLYLVFAIVWVTRSKG